MFNIIYADPAWAFNTYSDKGEGRTPQNHYHVMTIDDLCALPVSLIAAKDSVLLMWAVNPRLPDALRVGQAWGFEYKTIAFTWVKTVHSRNQQPTMFMDIEADYHWHMGMGYYTRANPEHCLLFTRGKSLKRHAMDVRQLVIHPIMEHSRKPDEVHERIERLWGDVSRVELFARREREGWVCLGNEINGLDLRDSIIQLTGETI